MSFITLAFSSNRQPAPNPARDRTVVPLSSLKAGYRGVIVDVRASHDGRADRLLALGVTPGARLVVLQTFPSFVFLCDQTELAVERSVADSVFVRVMTTAD
jgi:DtxR family transcriptional regulator, Mn-dependent transcriptional regulator